ncbi:MAG: hydroxymethylglutaryl-CoA lyase [Pseudomonadales bacterium]|nr:hydroxymethylglutaryl-CoA lyase [Pseudomonadales bacterium]
MNGLESVHIVEVGPRDGLQNEPRCLSVHQRVSLIQQLEATGLKEIECGSFVSNSKLPQMADTDKVMARLSLSQTCIYSALVPNQKAWSQAEGIEALQRIALFTSASELFCQHNIGCSLSESLKAFAVIIPLAKAKGLKIRVYLSCVWGCPYEGRVDINQSLALAATLLEMGCDQLSLADTIGIATQSQIKTVLTAFKSIDSEHIALHFHNSSGMAIANVMQCMDMGFVTFDSAIAGLGGCPFANALDSGNLATEDLVYLLHGLGIETGIDLKQLCSVGNSLCQLLHRSNASRLSLSLLNKSTLVI